MRFPKCNHDSSSHAPPQENKQVKSDGVQTITIGGTPVDASTYVESTLTFAGGKDLETMTLPAQAKM